MIAVTLRFLALSSLVLPSLALGRRCGNELSDEQVNAYEASYRSRLAAAPNTALPKADAAGAVSVYFHVIQAGDTLEQGNIPDSQITKQMEILNQGFNTTGLTFTLANTTRSTNATWFQNPLSESVLEKEMKTALHQGDATTLNVYTVGNLTDPDPEEEPLLGYATFPEEYKGNATLDGVVILYSTLPGGSEDQFNLGYTLVHETGHWVGLYHPFQGGCSSPNDDVDDTPAEESPTRGCPTTPRDSCPNLPGKDLIHNYMDYSDDECLNSFTAGQIERLKGQLAMFRAGIF